MILSNQHLQVAKAIKVLQQFVHVKRYDRFQQVIQQRTGAVRVVLENLQDPLNGVACLRTGDGYGLQHFDVIESIDKFKLQEVEKNSNAISTGVDRWLTIKHHSKPRDCLSQLKQEGYIIIGSSLNSRSQSLPDIINGFKASNLTSTTDNNSQIVNLNTNIIPKIAVVFGNEHRGLSKTLQDHCDYIFKLPMYGFAQSFNLNASVGMTLTILESLNVMRKKGYTISDPEQEIRSRSPEMKQKLDLHSGVLDLEKLNILKPEDLWSDKAVSDPKLNYPLSLDERNEVLLKWLLRTAPYCGNVLSRYNIELDIL